MSVLNIVKYGDSVLRSKTRDVHKVTAKIQKLITNMKDTMYAWYGIGLAAPQVGANYKIFIIDISREGEVINPCVFINPKIVEKSGAVSSEEGCLSFPEVYTEVRRYSDVKVKAKDETGKPFVLEAKNGSLLARAIQHENDHLNGVLFVDHARDVLNVEEQLAQQGLPALDKEYLLEEDELEQQIKNMQEDVVS